MYWFVIYMHRGSLFRARAAAIIVQRLLLRGSEFMRAFRLHRQPTSMCDTTEPELKPIRVSHLFCG